MTNRKPLLASITLILLLSFVALGVTACSNNNYNIALNQTYLELEVGGEVKLTAEVTRYAGKNKPVWSSTRVEIATVSDDGVVTAISAGAATIKATLEDKTACCTVVVKEAAPEAIDVESIKLDKTLVYSMPGGKVPLSATVTPSNATDKVTWQSMNTSIATVTDDGLVTIVGLGSTIITAIAGNKIAVCQIFAVADEMPKVDYRKVTLNRDSLELSPNETATITATVTPTDATDKTVTWQSMNYSVATVDSNGVVTAVADGATVITAKVGSSLAACIVTVKQSDPVPDNRFWFKTLKVGEGNLESGDVSSATETFSFANEIVAGSDVSYMVCRDLECTDVIPSKTVSLNTGDNVYYVLANFSDNSSKLYKVIVRRLASYTITFDSDGGSDVAPIVADEGMQIDLPKPKKTGYTFVYWKLNDTDRSYINYLVKCDATFKALYTANSYNATLDVNYPDATEENVKETVTYDSNYKFYVPTRAGYVFDGWFIGNVRYTDANGNSLSAWKFTESKTFVAHWTDKYGVSLSADGCNATLSGAGNYYSDDSVTIAANPQLGYNFVGWYDGEELFSNEIDYTFTMPERHLTLTAKFQIDEDVSNLVFTSTQTTFFINGTNDESVTEITIPEYATRIRYSAFRDCQLQTVNWLAVNCQGEESSRAFAPFRGGEIVNLNVGSKVENFAKETFYDCGITNVNYDGDISAWCAITFGNIFANPLYYGKNFYLQGESAYDIDLSEDLQVNDYAFGQVKFGTVNYLGSLEDWCAKSFGSYNTNPATYAENFYINGELLQDLAIPETVTSIGSYVFDGIKSITQLTLNGSVKSIGENAFRNCSNINIVNVDSLQTWLNIDFKNNYSNPLSYAKDLYVDGEKVVDVVVPDGIKEIKPYAFYFSSITGVQLTSQVKTIGDYAFYRSGLTSCDLTHVRYIGASAFKLSALSGELVIPDGVTELGGNAFEACRYITDVTIGSGLTTISEKAFQMCIELVNVTIAECVTEIGSYAFAFCRNLTTIEIPSTVVSIGYRALYSCNNLLNVVLYDGVKKIESGAFSTKLENVYYKGTQIQWEQIEIELPDTTLANKTVFFYSEAEPALNDEGTAYEGNYWHYVDGEVVVWTKDDNE